MKWDKMTTASMFESRTSSPSSPARRVTLAQPQGMRQSQPEQTTRHLTIAG